MTDSERVKLLELHVEALIEAINDISRAWSENDYVDATDAAIADALVLVEAFEDDKRRFLTS